MSTSNIFKVSTCYSVYAQWILPDIVIERILLRLPAIDLFYTRGVCTYWRSLISSADFVSAHLNRSKSDPSSHGLIVHNDSPFPLSKTPPGPFKSLICFTAYSVIVVGSVNGLICFAGNTFSDILPPETVIILNPSTGLSMKLPFPPKLVIDPKLHMVKFAFFCVDGIYKVAKIYSDSTLCGESMTIEGEVWDSSTGAWSPIAPILGYCISKRINWVSAPDVVIEQGLAASAYWVADTRGYFFVISLDFKTLVLNLTPLSNIQDIWTRKCLYSVLIYAKTSLIPASIDGNFVFLHNNVTNDGIYDVWTMGVDGQGDWNKTSEFHLDFPFQKCLNCVNGELLVRNSASLAIYDMQTGIKDDKFEFESISAISAHDFVGSLVSIEGFEYNVYPNAVIDVCWPYSCGSACSERRTGRLIKQALTETIQSDWELVLEQQERKKTLSDVKKLRYSEEFEAKERDIRVLKITLSDVKKLGYSELKAKEREIQVLKKIVDNLQMGFQTESKEIENSKKEIKKKIAKEIEKVKMAMGNMKKSNYVMVFGVSSASVGVALLGAVWYIRVRNIIK